MLAALVGLVPVLLFLVLLVLLDSFKLLKGSTVAQAMALGALRHSQAQVSLAVTGIAALGWLLMLTLSGDDLANVSVIPYVAALLASVFLLSTVRSGFVIDAGALHHTTWRGTKSYAANDFLSANAVTDKNGKAGVVLRFRTYAVQLTGRCREYADTILALPALQEWVEAAVAESEVIAAFEGTLESHTFSPAASTTWPSGAERVPAFATLGANSMSLPPSNLPELRRRRRHSVMARMGALPVPVQIMTM